MPPLVTLILLLCIVLFIVWAIQSYAPFDAPMKNIVCLAICLIMALVALVMIGVLPAGALR